MPSIPPPWLYSAVSAYREREYQFWTIAGGGVRSAGATPATGLLAGASLGAAPSRLVIDTSAGANKMWEWTEFIHQFDGSLSPAFWACQQEVSMIVDGVSPTLAAGDAVVGVELGSSKLTTPFATNMPIQGLGTIQARYNFASALWEMLIYDDAAVDVAVETCTTQPASLGAAQRHLRLFFSPGAAGVAYAQFYVNGALIHTSTNTRLASVGTGSGPDQGPGVIFTSGSNAGGRMQGSISHVKSVWYQPQR